MKLKKLIKFVTVLSLIVIIVLSCQTPASDSSGGGGSDDNETEKELANGVYAKLIVARISTVIAGTTYKSDSLEAIFSKYYDPCNAISDLQPTTVSCSDINGPNYPLTFQNNMYLYNEPGNINGFLELGLEHEFDVVGSTEVPSLTKSIILPAVEPTIITPADGEDVQKSSGLDVEWNGNTPGGNVVIVLISVANTNELISVETGDDGSYTFDDTQLSSLSNGQYYLHVERFNEEFITAPGYDDRSIIRARLLSSIFINLTD